MPETIREGTCLIKVVKSINSNSAGREKKSSSSLPTAPTSHRGIDPAAFE